MQSLLNASYQALLLTSSLFYDLNCISALILLNVHLLRLLSTPRAIHTYSQTLSLLPGVSEEAHLFPHPSEFFRLASIFSFMHIFSSLHIMALKVSESTLTFEFYQRNQPHVQCLVQVHRVRQQQSYDPTLVSQRFANFSKIFCVLRGHCTLNLCVWNLIPSATDSDSTVDEFHYHPSGFIIMGMGS